MKVSEFSCLYSWRNSKKILYLNYVRRGINVNSVGTGAFVIGLSQISSVFLLIYYLLQLDKIVLIFVSADWITADTASFSQSNKYQDLIPDDDIMLQYSQFSLSECSTHCRIEKQCMTIFYNQGVETCYLYPRLLLESTATSTIGGMRYYQMNDSKLSHFQSIQTKWPGTSVFRRIADIVVTNTCTEMWMQWKKSVDLTYSAFPWPDRSSCSAQWNATFRWSDRLTRPKTAIQIDQYGGRVRKVLTTYFYSTNGRYIVMCCQNDEFVMNLIQNHIDSHAIDILYNSLLWR